MTRRPTAPTNSYPPSGDCPRPQPRPWEAGTYTPPEQYGDLDHEANRELREYLAWGPQRAHGRAF